MDIREIIVVEGKKDSANLKRFLKVDTIETNGLNLSSELMNFLTELELARGLIIFTDPDHAGEVIRRKINQAIPGCKNAFVYYKTSRSQAKVGVEYANQEEIIAALSHLITFHDFHHEALTLKDLANLNILGHYGKTIREAIAEYYHLGYSNTKTFLKRLNYLQISYQQLEDLIEREAYAENYRII